MGPKWHDARRSISTSASLNKSALFYGSASFKKAMEASHGEQNNEKKEW